jgi:hypothetical protein
VWLFVERAKAQAGQDKQALQEFVSEYFEGGEAAVESHYQELLALLDEEIADVEEEFQHEVKAQEERDAIERDACLAPAGETWEMLLRQEAALDRSIDRKVRIILTLRKEHAQQQKEAARHPEDERSDRAAEELSKLVGLDARSESSAEETAAEILKSPEKSENVLENKASAAEALTHEAVGDLQRQDCHVQAIPRHFANKPGLMVRAVASDRAWRERGLEANRSQDFGLARPTVHPATPRWQIPASPAGGALRSNDRRQSRTTPAGCARPSEGGKWGYGARPVVRLAG